MSEKSRPYGFFYVLAQVEHCDYTLSLEHFFSSLGTRLESGRQAMGWEEREKWLAYATTLACIAEHCTDPIIRS